MILKSATVLVLSATLVACIAETVSNSKTVNDTIRDDGSDGTQLNAGLVALDEVIEPGDSLRLRFTLENVTGHSIKILPWGTALEPVLSADIFEVVYNDAVLPYRGRVVKRATPTDKDYLSIEAGAQVESVVNLSQAYDVRSPGIYTIQFRMASDDGMYQIQNHLVSTEVEPVVVERR